jgi:hypothetical protein
MAVVVSRDTFSVTSRALPTVYAVTADRAFSRALKNFFMIVSSRELPGHGIAEVIRRRKRTGP